MKILPMVSGLAHEDSKSQFTNCQLLPVVHSLTDAGAPSTQPNIHALPDSSISSDPAGDTFVHVLAPIKLSIDLGPDLNA